MQFVRTELGEKADKKAIELTGGFLSMQMVIDGMLLGQYIIASIGFFYSLTRMTTFMSHFIIMENVA